ncbi:MAG: single-stranded DNA-binding protein [Cytophagales bacterium]|jgi:single-strand DNA-binding protein|nr:single-stranded DNA-binding protein [Cytophagales bacterium]MCA6372287.1 single-stranded DNA-binding protein [Cytophagales bacterium]MCA6382432.1 single-stranded DNA-binding protein [Cytophagales bacterium]
MSGVNKVILMGRVGKDVAVRAFDNGNKVASFSLATSEKYKDKAGVVQEITEWHNLSIFGKLADVAEKYVKKGDQLYVSGKLKTRSWEKDGITRYTTEIVVDELNLIGGNKPAVAEQREEAYA